MALLDLFDLTGKVAVVTGASAGLGVAFARGLAEAGADVAVIARRADRLKATCSKVEAIGRRALAVPTDVADAASCQAAIDTVMAELGRVDILVNNAGLGTAYPATRELPDQFREVIDVNLCGSYWMAQACGRVMEPGSSIVNLSSTLAFTSGPLPQAAYVSSKAAIVGLTRDLANQWTPRRGIRVNALAPGYFASEMSDQFPDGYMDAQMSRTLVGRLGDAAALAATLVWLVSPAAEYVTGQTIVVDGGYSVT